MLTKILITGLVIVAAMAMQRFRTRTTREAPVVKRVRVEQPVPKRPTWVKPAAYGFAALVVASAAAVYYMNWQADQRIVNIRVINTATGDVATYQAHRGDIDGRTFTTVDGLSVRMADADRFEVVETGQ